jgi:hypothetical protein
MLTGDPRYAAEKFSLAVHALATGAGPIKERLAAAFTELCPVSERDLPEALLADYQWIRHQLTKREARQRAVVGGRVVVGVEGRLGATLLSMRTPTAVSIAERICAVTDRLLDYNER